MFKTAAVTASVLVTAAILGSPFLAKATVQHPSDAGALTPPPIARGVTKVADNQTFAGVCKGTEAVDTRPDPAWVGASFAKDGCRAAPMPVALDGYSVSLAQIQKTMVATKKYVSLADRYQKCISNFLIVQKMLADKRNKPVDASLVIIENHRVAVSQRDQKKAVAQISNTIEDYNMYGSTC